MKRIFICLCATALLSACFGGKTDAPQNPCVSDTISENIEIKYATHLKIKKFDNYYYAEIRNPWDTSKNLVNYVIVDANSDSQISVPENSVLVKSPISNALVFTSLHAHLLKELGCLNSIGAVCDADYILDSEIKNLVSEGKIKDLGSSMSPDLERVMIQSPDAIFLSPFENSNGYGALSKVKAAKIECADYMETSPLAQAEWVKFYGLLMGKFAKADSIFVSVEKKYNDLISSVKRQAESPKLLANIPISGTWYIPTGKSTAGRFYSDAGADYLFSDLDGYGSKPLDFEKVFARAHDADIWLFKYNSESDFTLETFANENPKFKNFKALADKRVYACNLSYSPFYDEIPFHPELLLKDLIKICYPDALENYSLKYYKPLK